MAEEGKVGEDPVPWTDLTSVYRKMAGVGSLLMESSSYLSCIL